MRILQVGACPYPSPQGSQVYLRGTALALAAAGHEVTIAAYAHGEGPLDPHIPVVRTPRIPGYGRMRSGPDPVKPVLDLALVALIARQRVDLVHAHNYEALAAALLARARTGVPVVYAAHTLLEEELPTYVSRGRRAWRALGSALDHTLPRRADAVLALSARGATALRSSGCRRVTHVPPGVFRDDFAGVRPRRMVSGPTVVYAGTPDVFQDLDVLFAAMRALPDVTLLLVSSGSWTGWPVGDARIVRPASWGEARDWIAGADVAVLPRSRCAGFPIKLLNYLALGRPTVVAAGSAQGLPGEVVVANRDARAFADGVRRAFTTPAPDPAGLLDAWAWSRRAVELERLYGDVMLGGAASERAFGDRVRVFG